MGVLLELLRWCEKRWTHIAPTQEWLAAKLKWTLRTLQRTVAALKKAGLLLVIPRYKRSALYKLVHMRENPQMSFDFLESPRQVEGWSNPTRGAQSLPEAIPAPERVCEPSRIGAESHVRKPGEGRLKTDPSRPSPNQSGGPDGGAEFKTSLRLVRREVSVPLVIFLKPVHARKPPRRQTALERASERFLREG